MVFSSQTFLFFFLPLAGLCVLIRSKPVQNALLLIASLIFYAWGEPKMVVLMVLVTLIAYGSGFAIVHFKARPRAKKAVLIASVVVILGNLVVFKYLNFLCRTFSFLGLTDPGIALPIGISFYTFQILSYVIDLYRGKIALQRNFFYLLMYVSFFPQLIAGPIVRYETVEQEIRERSVTMDDLAQGFRRFVVGLAKKLLLANQDEENFPLTASVERRSFDVLLPIMETADAPFLSQDVSVWQENIDWLQKVGMIDAAFDPAEVMVDLLAEYEKVGLQLDCRELPDYLPLYLEYLSVLPDDQAKEGLLNVAPILALLGGRLKQREAPWYALFDTLLQLAGSTLSSDSVTKQVNSEERDDTRQALDAVWEEEQVKFIEDNATACDSSPLNQYQRRFSQDVAPQYVDISAGGGK